MTHRKKSQKSYNNIDMNTKIPVITMGSLLKPGINVNTQPMISNDKPIPRINIKVVKCAKYLSKTFLTFVLSYVKANAPANEPARIRPITVSISPRALYWYVRHVRCYPRICSIQNTYNYY